MIDLIGNESRTFKNKKSFNEFIKEQDSKTKIKLVKFPNWKFTEDGLKIKKKVYPLRDSGMKTLLKTFGMPNKFYYEKAPTDMLIRDVNRMKKEYTPDSEIMVHFDDKEIRAVSKPTTKAIKLTDILAASEISNKSFKEAHWTDYGLRISTSEDEKAIKVSKNDIIDVGIELMYSNIGYFPTSGSPFLLRLVCTNGMVIKEKSPLLNRFSISAFAEMPDENFLERINTNIKLVTADAKKLQRTFKVMKDHSVRDLTRGSHLMKSIRSTIGSDKFDDHEKLSKKVMIDEKERTAPNLDLELYSLLDITTRMAKSYDFFNRRKLEGLGGSLIIASERELANG